MSIIKNGTLIRLIDLGEFYDQFVQSDDYILDDAENFLGLFTETSIGVRIYLDKESILLSEYDDEQINDNYAPFNSKGMVVEYFESDQAAWYKVLLGEEIVWVHEYDLVVLEEL